MKEQARRISKIMNEVAPGFSISGLTIFLLVAQTGQMSVKAIGDRIQSSQAVVLRYATEMTAWKTSEGKGPGLLEIQAAGLLKKNVVLTKKGFEVKKRIEGNTEH